MHTRLSDAFKPYPITNPNILDLQSMTELPDSHAWLSQDDHQSPSSFTSSPPDHHHHQVPVISLKDPNAMKLIGHACKTWGVFQLTNHGVDTNLLQDMESAGRNLFSLPIQQKKKAVRAPNGASGYGVARISAFFPKLMWSEGFTIIGSPYEHARKLWPNGYYKEFCDVIEEYKEEMNKLAQTLMFLMLGSLGVTMEDVNWASAKGSSPALQLNSYPACPDPERAMGLAPHTDSTLFTILHQSNISGLQAHKEGIGWVPVPPTPGALVVNVGDLLHILSNGLYTSVLHRAVVNRTQHRLSVAFLYGPPSNVQISPLSKLTDQVHPPLYRPVTWSEYLGTKAIHFNKALSSVRLCAPLNGFGDTNDHNGVQVG